MADPSPADTKNLGQMLSLLAHDLRNPLSALLTNLSFVATSPPVERDEILSGALSDCTVACDSLKRMIANLDVLAHWFGAGQLHPRRLLLADVARDSVARFRATAEMQNIELELDIHETDVEVMADAELVGRALDNALAHAVAYGPTGVPVRVAVSRQDRDARIDVTDRGPAVSDERRAEVFTAEGQVQAHNVSNTRYGRGLGLFAAAVAVQASGGSISLQSETVGGARVTIRLPLSSP